MATLRGLIRAGTEISRLGWDRDGETPSSSTAPSRSSSTSRSSGSTTDFTPMEELLKESFERITALYEAGADVTGIAVRVPRPRPHHLGLPAGQPLIIAARPSMGKSALRALHRREPRDPRTSVPVALFTLEMSKAEVTQRLLCSEAKVDSQRLRTRPARAPTTGRAWPRPATSWRRRRSTSTTRGSITMIEIRSKARRLKSQHPELGLIVLDYLQLMTLGASASRTACRRCRRSRASLKVLARDLEVPIIALSQLSRAVEQRHDKRPMLSDLRESGSIEQDADLVVFIYRDEYYNDDTDQQGVAEVIVAKHRNGPTDAVKLSLPQALREVRRPGCRAADGPVDDRARPAIPRDERATRPPPHWVDAA